MNVRCEARSLLAQFTSRATGRCFCLCLLSLFGTVALPISVASWVLVPALQGKLRSGFTSHTFASRQRPVQASSQKHVGTIRASADACCVHLGAVLGTLSPSKERAARRNAVRCHSAVTSTTESAMTLHRGLSALGTDRGPAAGCCPVLCGGGPRSSCCPALCSGVWGLATQMSRLPGPHPGLHSWPRSGWGCWAQRTVGSFGGGRCGSQLAAHNDKQVENHCLGGSKCE